MGIHYQPTAKAERESFALALGQEINGMDYALRIGNFPWQRDTQGSVDIHSLLLPSKLREARANLADGSLIQREVDRYLYPYFSWEPGAEPILKLSTKELREEFRTVPGAPRPLPSLKQHLGSLLFQQTVDSKIRKPLVGEGPYSLSFLTEDPLLRDALKLILEESSLGAAVWSGSGKGILIYDPIDLPPEILTFVEQTRQSVAEDLVSARSTIDGLQQRGNLHSIEAVPIFPSLHSNHSFGYRISYNPSSNFGSIQPAVVGMVSREELEALARGIRPVGSGAKLQSKELDFSQNLL